MPTYEVLATDVCRENKCVAGKYALLHVRLRILTCI